MLRQIQVNDEDVIALSQFNQSLELIDKLTQELAHCHQRQITIDELLKQLEEARQQSLAINDARIALGNAARAYLTDAGRDNRHRLEHLLKKVPTK